MVILSLSFALVTYTVWLITMYSSKLSTLQERVTELERNCVLNEQTVQDLIAQNVDKLLQEVRRYKIG